MDITQKIIKTVGYVLDKESDALIGWQNSYIGKPLSRVDGELKVKGEASFAEDYKLENLAYAALIYSTIAKGKITKINQTEAEKVAGLVKIITYQNQLKIKQPPVFAPGSGNGESASDLPIMQDANIHWNGQPVAVVVAETQEQADQAVSLIKVEYETETAKVSFAALKSEAVEPSSVLGEPSEIRIGDAEDALEKAEFKVDGIYRTPRYNHNAIEPHGTVAVWHEDETLTVFEPTQNLRGIKRTLAEIFGIEPVQVRIVSPFVGGGFGGKAFLWNHIVLCAAAAKMVKRPVKLALSREGVFRVVGGRAPTEQRVALGARRDGKLTALLHTGASPMNAGSLFPEPFTRPARRLYAAENFLIGQKVVHLDMLPNTAMRAPGESVGSFALESAMDELAFELKIDPIELRRINEPAKDPIKNTEFSMRNLTEAYKRGAEKFGWKNTVPRSQKSGKLLIGQGVATALRAYLRNVGSARIRINADGTALVSVAAQEMGMGMATAQIQHVAERLGLPIDKISFEYGDSNLPESPRAGGSMQTASVSAAISQAVENLHQELLALAGDDCDSPLADLRLDEVEARSGGLFSKKNSVSGETYESILKRIGQEYVEIEATSAPPLESTKYSMASYGAQFCEVSVNEESGEVRVLRWLGSFDCGRIINPKTATSQFRGGIIMGIGMALMEETLFDERTGRIMNPSLAEYHVPVNLDVPEIDTIYNDIPDEHAPLGARGVGEIGITGAAAAIANAVFNATGKRIRDLPLTLDKINNTNIYGETGRNK